MTETTQRRAELTALDLFAGTGWGVACRRLGIREVGVDLMEAVVQTRAANGMETAYRDVWQGLLDPWGQHQVEHQVLIASPPCQTFSRAGKGEGVRALADVFAAIERGDYRDPVRLFDLTTVTDPRTALVLTPLAHVWRDRPMYVAMEQVPQVLPVWEACAVEMREMGYSVWTGYLHSEQYGVPQTRKRAMLIARRDGVEATPPPPTHSQYHLRAPERMDPGVLPWVSMAEALGWGLTKRPYPTVASGTGGGGTDPAALGGSAARRLVYEQRAAGDWLPSGDADNDSGILRVSPEQAAVLQSYPPFDLDALRAIGAERMNNQSGTAFDLAWMAQRPALTIAGRDIVPMPGATANRYNGSTKSRNDGIRVEPSEAATLQSYPEGFVWCGDRTRQYEQIGNAVPPLMAQAVLAHLVPA